MADNRIVTTTTTPVSSGADLAPLAVEEITRFDAWASKKLGHPLVNGERMILKDYLYWKVMIDNQELRSGPPTASPTAPKAPQD